MFLGSTGASGQLGSYLLRELHGRAELIAWSGSRRGDLFGVPLLPVDFTHRSRDRHRLSGGPSRGRDSLRGAGAHRRLSA